MEAAIRAPASSAGVGGGRTEGAPKSLSAHRYVEGGSEGREMLPCESLTASCALLTPHLLVTCRHVLPHIDLARAAQATFYIADTKHGLPVPTACRLQPDALYLSSAEEDERRQRAGEEPLDFALVSCVLDVPSTSQAPVGVESVVLVSPWRTERPKSPVRVVGVHPGRRAVETHPPGQMLEVRGKQEGRWAHPIRYRASAGDSYSGGAVLTLALNFLGIHQGGIEDECNFGCPIQAILHCAAAVWERQQRERAQGIPGVEGAAHKNFVRLVRAQGIPIADIASAPSLPTADAATSERPSVSPLTHSTQLSPQSL